jgi:hypothetical protein
VVEETEDDVAVVRNDADLPLVCDAFGDVGDELFRAARRCVHADDMSDARAAVRPAFEREPEGAPVGLAGGVVVDTGEADAFEPPRGSWAQVSLVVVAVDDHRRPTVEKRRRVLVERLERDVDSAGQVLVFEIVRRKDLDELGPLLAPKALDFVTVNRCRHVVSFRRCVAFGNDRVRWFEIIPPLLHGYADIIVTVALIVLPFIVGFSEHTTALVFYLVVGAGGLAATLVTRFEPRMAAEHDMTLRMAS